jgi:hypothetical protein
MKKQWYIMGMAVVMMAACSSEDNQAEGYVQPVVTEERPHTTFDDNLTREDLMGNIPIELGSYIGASTEVEEQTRGSITDADFATTTMGVFCISAGKILDGLSNDDILRSWSGNVGNYLNMLNLWQDNVKAHVENLSYNNGKVRWDDRNARHYYPSVNYFKYHFVAYYPYTTAIQRAKDGIWAWVTIDGDDDVLYSIADAPEIQVNDETDALAYSNEYFNRIKQNSEIADGYKPYFKFSHVTAKLKFTVRLKSASTVGQLHVDSISFKDFINTMKLGIAKYESGVKSNINAWPVVTNYNSVPDSLQDRIPAVRGHFWLREQDGTSISGKKEGNGYKYAINTTDKKPIGDCIMIPPLPASVSSANINLEVFLRDEYGNQYTTVSPIRVAVPAAGWEMAKEYTINVSITPPSNLIDDTRGASVGEWGVDVINNTIEVSD